MNIFTLHVRVIQSTTHVIPVKITENAGINVIKGIVSPNRGNTSVEITAH